MKTHVLIRLSIIIGGRILFFLLGCQCSLFAQSTSPYQSLQPSTLFDNPANVSFDSIRTIRYQLMTSRVSVAANSATLGMAQYGNSVTTLLREHLIKDHPLSKGWGSVDLRGPAISFSIPQSVTVSLLTRVRLIGDYHNVNGKLLSEIGEESKLVKTYPYEVQIKDMKTHVAAFSEIALGLAKPIFKKNEHQLVAGITFKMLRSNGHTSISIPTLGGTVDKYQNNDDLIYLTEAKGKVNTSTAGEIFSDFTVQKLLNSSHITLGMDLGLQYEWRPTNTLYPRLVVGASITDIGGLKFSPQVDLSQSYEIEIAQPEKLFFNTHFNNADFSKTAEIYDQYPQLFLVQDRQQSDYKIRLPTALKLQVRTQFTKSFAASIDINKGLINSSKLYLNDLEWVCIVPEWNWKSHTFYAPISYTSTKMGMLGIVYKYKGLTVGSHSLANALGSSSRNLDLFIGIAGQIPTRRTK